MPVLRPQHPLTHPRLTRLLLLWLTLPLLLGQAAPDALKQQRQKLEETLKQEDSVLDALETIDRAIQEQEQKLEQARTRQKQVEERIASLEQERTELEDGLVERRVLLQQRLRALYKYSNKGFMQALLGGGSGTEILKRMKYLQIIIERDMALVQKQRRAIARAGEIKEQLETERLQVQALTTDVEQQMVQAQGERLRKKELLEKLRTEKGIDARRLKELELAAAALARKMEPPPPKPVAEKPSAEPTSPLRQKADEKSGFAAQIGRLPYPVPAGKVTRAFGRYKLEGMKVSETHRGLDITAPAGADIKAIYQGEVKLAEWFKGYGLLMIIDHGDGYHSIYAHASKLLKNAGDKVKTGEKIALVGDTGSFQGPYLYLEVRENGKPVNPIQWIRVPPEAMAIE